MMHTDKIAWQSILDRKKSGQLYAWLSYAGSFMQRLAQHGIHSPTIDVLREDWISPEPWECELLRLQQHDKALVREVCIFSDTSIWLYARTVFPSDILSGKQELSRLENRALGSVLFQDPDIKRGDLEFSYSVPSELWQNFPPKCYEEPSWVRRSLFTLHDHSLLLTEILMPDLTKLCMKN